MLEPLKHLLSSQRIVLASASPRRKEILSTCFPSFEVFPSKADENLEKASYKGRPWKYAEDTATLKATEVYRRLVGKAGSSSNEDKSEQRDGGGGGGGGGRGGNFIVVGADTVVAVEEEKGQGEVIYEKPTSGDDAENKLRTLSGKEHSVHTGVCIISGGGRKVTFHESTKVRFSDLPEDVIKAYVASGEPMDKAGGYGIQALGGTLVSSIDGCYFNVVGFPINKFCRELRAMLLSPPDEVKEEVEEEDQKNGEAKKLKLQ